MKIGDIIPITEVPAGSELNENGRRFLRMARSNEGNIPVLDITSPSDEWYCVATMLKRDSMVELTGVHEHGNFIRLNANIVPRPKK